jgi:hypothetical protein
LEAPERTKGTGVLSDGAELQDVGVSVRLKIEDSGEELLPTISQRDDTGKAAR